MKKLNKDNNKSAPSAEELEKINRYSKKELTADEVYTFSINLCDNDIDRDGECFSDEALESLAALFMGKTAVLDHMAKSSNQVARTYETEVLEIKGKTNSLDKPYKVLRAKAYMPRTEKNQAFIEEIEAGIKKEVSISCSAKKRTCSLCGKQAGSFECKHIPGREYDGKKCYAVLDDISDAYEWSFVAVPAQKNAAVTKNYKIKKGEKMLDIIKSFADASGDITISNHQAKKLYDYIKSLEQKAEGAAVYRDSLCAEIKKLASLVLPSLASESAAAIGEKASIEELLEIKKALKEKADEIMPFNVQLSSEKSSRVFNEHDYNI